MDDDFDSAFVEPLLQFAHADPEPQVCLAALEAVTHFPLDRHQWQSVADAAWRVVQSEPAASPARRDALAFAAGIPLRSLREHLRSRANDDAEPDRDIIAEALAVVADSSRIAPLVAGLASGHMENYRPLAAMPLEDSGVSAADLPAPGPQYGDDAHFWRALCLARLGDFAELGAVFASDEILPPCSGARPGPPMPRSRPFARFRTQCATTCLPCSPRSTPTKPPGGSATAWRAHCASRPGPQPERQTPKAERCGHRIRRTRSACRPSSTHPRRRPS